MLDSGWMAEECKASHSSGMLRQFDEEEVSRTAEKSTLMKEQDKGLLSYMYHVSLLWTIRHTGRSVTASKFVAVGDAVTCLRWL